MLGEQRRTLKVRLGAHPGRVLAAASVLLVLVLAGCGTSSGPKRPRGCPGAVKCPYRSVALIGQRGEGVLRDPEAVALDGHGNVYVGDQFSYVVQRFSTSGAYEGEFGSYGTGAGQFGTVSGLAVDAAGDVYLVDASHDRVERFTAGGQFISEWGSPGSGLGQFHFGAGNGPDGPPGGGIAVEGDYVYVSDTGNGRIERFTLEGGDATILHPHIVNWRPLGLAATATRLFVADGGQRQVDELTHHGQLIRRAGSFGTGPRQFANPFDVGVDRLGHVFVVDDNNNRVVVLNARLRSIRTFRGKGAARLGYVRALASDPYGRVYVADTSNNRIEVFNARGNLEASWGRSGETGGELVEPLDVTATPQGGPIVIGTFGSRSPIFQFSASTLQLSAEWDRGGTVLGQHFFAPTAVAVSPNGSVWITDPSNDVVRHLSDTGRYLDALQGPRAHLSHPSGVAVGPGGDVYVADTGDDRIERFSRHGHLEAILGASEGLHDPVAVAVDARGRIFVADTGNSRVVVMGPHGYLIAAFGHDGPSADEMSVPVGIAVDAAGTVFVSELGSDRIQEFTSHGRYLTSWGALGPGPGEFDAPGGISIDCLGDLLVADTRNNRVQVFRGVASPGRCTSPPPARIPVPSGPATHRRRPVHHAHRTVVAPSGRQFPLRLR
ncbi:MAG TPA: NHL repeat-containing protein [Solirubrobacteraceae bacterium]|nr:NHL repeat-containing protein [Solirubrobacteraceae bacterium]